MEARCLAVCVILLAVVSLSGAAYCDGVDYDPLTQVCCSGKITDTEHRMYDCCDGKPYDYSEWTCCDGELRRGGGKFFCCGDGVYDTNNEVCCAGKPVKGGFWHYCCGEVAYTNKHKRQYKCGCGDDDTLLYEEGKFSCVDGQLLNKKGKPVNGKPEVPNKLESCGTIRYDPEEKICCHNGLVIDKKPGAGCCGGEPYNSTTHTCCMTIDSVDIVKGGGTHTACCGHGEKKKSYNYDTHHCCKDKIKPKVKGSEKKDHDCCKYHPYVSSSQGCCGGKKVYDKENDMCCDGRVAKNGKKYGGTTCCGRKSYNKAQDLCCGNKRVVKNGKSNGKECCGLRPFTSDTHICCDDEKPRPRKRGCPVLVGKNKG